MATTTTVNKTVGTSSMAWVAIATANSTVNAAIDVSTKMAISFLLMMGRASGTAFTAGWPNFRVEASVKSSGVDSFVPLSVFTPAVGASIANTTLNGAVSAAATSCVVTSATNIAAGDYLFLGHTTTSANWELVRVKSVSGTTVTFEEPCTNAHDNTAQVTDQAESYFPQFDVSAYSRVRVVADNANGGVTMNAQILYTTMDSLATA